MSIFPKNGIQLAGIEIDFPSIEEFYNLNEDSTNNDTKDKALQLLLKQLKEDSIKVDRKIKEQLRDSIEKSWKKLQYPNNDKTILYPFFKKLENARSKKVRIMHFGDSQIEADRITSYVRNELQKLFGGNGACLFSIEQVTRKMSVKQSH